ncbi:MAG: hypothetical protein AAGC68_00070, partial [Verrucomicrobiota bacterium]
MMGTCHFSSQRPAGSCPLGFWAITATAIALLTSSCATFPEPNVSSDPEVQASRTVAPPESRFVKMNLKVSTETGSVPTWRTRSYGKPVLLLHPVN